MKANRKFLRGDDAVSPVIAVILMVAITVVLAATVYVWVSGFSAGGSAPAKSMALTSNGPLSSSIKSYTVASATSGMKWSDLDFTLDGAALTLDLDCTPEASEYSACNGSTIEADTDTVNAGDIIKIYSASSGTTFRILDANANSVVLTLTVG